MSQRRAGTAIEAAVDTPVAASSARAFGWLMAGVAALVGLWALWKGKGWMPWPFAIAIAFALITLLELSVLHALNRWWMGLAAFLGRVVTPLVMGLIYFGLVTPLGLLMRLSGKDPMQRRFDPTASSYWIEREPKGPDPTTMERQF
jgi:hypothetical protein